MYLPRREEPRIGSHELGPAMRSYAEVADEWYRRTGQRLSSKRIHQICMLAERKIRRRWLERFGAEWLDDVR